MKDSDINICDGCSLEVLKAECKEFPQNQHAPTYPI